MNPIKRKVLLDAIEEKNEADKKGLVFSSQYLEGYINGLKFNEVD